MDTSRGRFWSMDLIDGVRVDPRSLHKYLYANANPVGFVDPSGMSAAAVHVFVSTAIGGLARSLSAAAVVAGYTTLQTAAAIVIGSIGVAILVDATADAVRWSAAELGIFSVAFDVAADLMRREFTRWWRDPRFKKAPGKHWAELSGPSGLVGTPRVQLGRTIIGGVDLRTFAGGKPGRVFEFKYGIGANAGGTGRLFLFRFDYMDFRKFPPEFFLHYHLRAWDIRIDHEPLL